MTKTDFLSAIPKTEDDFQIMSNRYINANFPDIRHFYFHVPNESATSDAMRMKLFAKGVLPGVPDFIFLKPKTWAIELKMPNGTVSPKQKALQKLWFTQCGIETFICRTPADVVFVLDQML